MKKTALALLVCLLSAGVYAQNQGQNQQGQSAQGANALDAAMKESLKKDKEKSDKAITEEKTAAKANTWLDRAKTYQNIAAQAPEMDPNAAMVAYDSYKKVVELDKDKKGGPGRLAKEADEALKGQSMYATLMNAGAAKYQAKEFGEAVKLMRMAGDIMPKDTTAALFTGIAAQQNQDNTLAKEAFERYAANGGKDPSVYYSLATLYRNDKETDKAMAALDKGLVALPGNKDLQAEKVNIMLSSGQTEQAIASMKELVAKDPNNVQNLLNLGILYDNAAGKLSEQIRKAEGESRKGGDVQKKLADDKATLDVYTSEIARLSAALKKQPKNAAELRRQLTDVQNKQKELKASVAQAETEAKQATANPASGGAGQLADLKKQFEEQRSQAKEYYDKVLAIEPNNYDANFNLGVFYFNEAVELKKTVDQMSMADYQKNGKQIDGQVCGKFKQAEPYFLKAKAVKEEADLTENLNTLQNVLKQYEQNKIVCVESK